MLLVRPSISRVIFGRQQGQRGNRRAHHQQQPNHNRSPNTRCFRQSSPQISTPSLPIVTRLKQLVNYSLNSMTRLVIRAVFQDSSRTSDNAILATTSINRVLRYSYGSSSTQTSHTLNAKGDVAAQDRAMTSHPTNEEDNKDVVESTVEQPKVASNKMVGLEDYKSDNTLESLRESYANCRKDASNVWLDFAHKSCYVYLYHGGGEPNRSLAAFDMDGTLIKPKSNKRIPRSATDWELFSVWTKIKLQQCLREKRARFVIFTNQNGVGLEIVPLREVQHRIELVTKSLDIPCTVFVAIEKDTFRKPQTGMFQLFNECFNDSLPLDLLDSFYCGDAVGYPSHSDADIQFAKQLGLPFITPEKFLRGVKPKLVA